MAQTKPLRIFLICCVLLAILLSIRNPVQASRPVQRSSNQVAPDGLDVEDWSAINTLLRESLPVQEAYLKASNTSSYDYFGRSVAVDGDTVVIGAHGEDSNATGVNGNQTNNSALYAGAAYVFVRDQEGVWSQQAYLKASNTDPSDRFGVSVAIDGNTIAVGAFKESSNATGINGIQTDNSAYDSGAVYVFTREGNIWSQQAYIKASNTDANDRFGLALALDGETLVVGASQEASNATGINGNQSDNSMVSAGAVYAYHRNGSTWSQTGYIKASNTGENDQFGFSVSISGNTLAVGALGESSNTTGIGGNQFDNSMYAAGAVYVFTYVDSNWSQQAYIKASNTNIGDQFGFSVSISGNTLAVGADFEQSNAIGINGNQSDNSAVEAGAAYIFTRNGSAWSQQAYIKASNTDAHDHFGCTVDISGEMLLVGAYGESSASNDVNGDQADNSLDNAGAAYLFSRSESTWIQLAYVKPEASSINDLFGIALSIDAGTLLIGSYYEDSSSTGVDGNPSDNSMTDAGAAYIFTSSSGDDHVCFLPLVIR